MCPGLGPYGTGGLAGHVPATWVRLRFSWNWGMGIAVPFSAFCNFSVVLLPVTAYVWRSVVSHLPVSPPVTPHFPFLAAAFGGAC